MNHSYYDAIVKDVLYKLKLEECRTGSLLKKPILDIKTPNNGVTSPIMRGVVPLANRPRQKTVCGSHPLL